MTDMIEFEICVPPKGTRWTKSEFVSAPVLPRPGDYISHDALGISGRVASVQFWWDEDSALHIEVRLEAQ